MIKKLQWNPLRMMRVFRIKRISSLFNIYWLLIFINSIQIFRFKWDKETIVYNSLVLLIIGSFIISRLYPNYLSKEMLLMPLSKKEQIRCVKRHYWYKVIGNSVIQIIAYGFVYYWDMLTLGGFCVAVLFSILWNLATQLYYDTTLFEKSKLEKHKCFKGCMMWQIITLVVDAILLMMLFTSVLDHSLSTFDRYAISIGLGIQFLLTWKVLKSYYHPILECEVCFEEEGEEKQKGV